MAQKPIKLLDPIREAIHHKHYAYRTKQSHVDWVKRFMAVECDYRVASPVD